MSYESSTRRNEIAFSAGAIVSKLQLDRKKFSASIKTAGKQVKGFGGMVKSSGAQLKKMGMAVTALGAVAVFTFSKMVKKYVEVGDMIDKMSKRTGFAAETLSELAHAADISGADITSLEKATKKMSKAIVDASDGLETYLRVFRSLGLEVEDLLELNPEEQFLKIGEAIADLESDTLRTAAAVDVFGRAGTLLIPLFKEGVDGMRALREEAHTLGIVFDEEAAAKAAKLKDAQTNLKAAFQGFGFTLAEEFVPILTNVADTFTEMVVDMRGDAKFLIEGLVDFFTIGAKGVMGLMLAFEVLQAFMFDMAAATTKVFRDYIGKLIAGFGVLARLHVPGAKKALSELAQAYIDLGFVQDSYFKEADKHREKGASIIEVFEKLKTALADIKTGLTEGKKEIISYSETLVETLLPAAKDTSKILEDIRKKTKEAEDALKEKAKQAVMMTEAEGAAFFALREAYTASLDALLDVLDGFLVKGKNLFKAIWSALKTLGLSLVGTMKNLLVESMAIAIKEILISKAKALAGIIASIVKAIPFPLNIIAIGAGIALINKFFSAIPSFAEGGKIGREGGLVGEEGPEMFVPDRSGTIVPLKEMARGVGGMTFAPNIIMKIDAMDSMGIAEFMRNRGIPEIVEALKMGIQLSELQEALKI